MKFFYYIPSGIKSVWLPTKVCYWQVCPAMPHLPCKEAPNNSSPLETNHFIWFHDKRPGESACHYTCVYGIHIWLCYLPLPFLDWSHWYEAQTRRHVQVDWALHGPLVQVSCALSIDKEMCHRSCPQPAKPCVCFPGYSQDPSLRQWSGVRKWDCPQHCEGVAWRGCNC